MQFQDELEQLLSKAKVVLKEDLVELRTMSATQRQKLYNQIKEDEDEFKYEFEPQYRTELQGVDTHTFRGQFITARLFLHVASLEDPQADPLAPSAFTEDECQAIREFDQYRAFDISDKQELKRRIENKDDEIYEFVVEEVTEQVTQQSSLLESQTNDIRTSVMSYLRDQYRERVETAEQAVSIYIQQHGLPNIIESIEEAAETTASASLTREDVRNEVQDAISTLSEQMLTNFRDQERSIRARIDQLSTEINNRDQDPAQIQEELTELQQEIEQLETSQHEEAARLDTLVDEIDQQRRKLDQQIEKINEKQHEIANEAAESATRDLSANAEKLLEDELERLTEQRSELTAEIEHLRREREQIDAANNRLQDDVENLRQRLDSIETSFDTEEETLPENVAPAEDARLYELDYIGRVEASLENTDTIYLPSGKEYQISSEYWNSTGHLEKGDQRDRLRDFISSDRELGRHPLGRFLRAEIIEGGLFSRKKKLVIEAIVHCNLEAFARNGFDASPAGVSDLLDVVNRTLNRAEQHNTPHIVAVASPTGWTEKVIDEVEAADLSRARFGDNISVCLIDLQSDSLYFDRTDTLLSKNRSLFERKMSQEQVAECKQIIREQYIQQNARHVLLKDIAHEYDYAPQTIREAFEQLEQDGVGQTLATDAGMALDLDGYI